MADKKEIKQEELSNVAGGSYDDTVEAYCPICKETVTAKQENRGTTCSPQWHYKGQCTHEWDE